MTSQTRPGFPSSNGSLAQFRAAAAAEQPSALPRLRWTGSEIHAETRALFSARKTGQALEIVFWKTVGGDREARGPTNGHDWLPLDRPWMYDTPVFLYDIVAEIGYRQTRKQ